MEERETIAVNLRKYRQHKGLSQKELAERVGVSSDTISRLESARQQNPGLQFLKSVCKELNVSIEELVMQDPQKLRIDIIVSDKNVKVIEAIIQVFRNFNLVQ